MFSTNDFKPYGNCHVFMTLLYYHFINILEINTDLTKLKTMPEGVNLGDLASQLVIALAMGTVVYHSYGGAFF